MATDTRALEGLKSGRIDAYAGTRLIVESLLGKAGGGMESAQPFTEPVLGGHKARGYGAFGFRKQDKGFVNAFNAQLKGFVGSTDHLKPIHPFGFSTGDMLGNYLIAMFKDAPVLSVITMAELLQEGKIIGSETFRYTEPLTLGGVMFLLLSMLSAGGLRYAERRLRLPGTPR